MPLHGCVCVSVYSFLSKRERKQTQRDRLRDTETEREVGMLLSDLLSDFCSAMFTPKDRPKVGIEEQTWLKIKQGQEEKTKHFVSKADKHWGTRVYLEAHPLSHPSQNVFRNFFLRTQLSGRVEGCVGSAGNMCSRCDTKGLRQACWVHPPGDVSAERSGSIKEADNKP